MKDNPIVTKSLAFALRIVKLARYLADEHKEFTLSREVLTSGTGIGKFVILAESGESPESFVLNIARALQRADETEYWLVLIHYAELIKDHEFESIEADRKELAKILTTIVKTSRKDKL
ncbi:MAG TPA: four helix bundle protein [Pyrinomonadaceae bacterium]|nr:four helix bundle protein [Pyrinomonadaceae bacterium]